MGKSTDDEQTIGRLRREAAREFWLEWSNGIWGLLIKPLAYEANAEAGRCLNKDKGVAGIPKPCPASGTFESWREVINMDLTHTAFCNCSTCRIVRAIKAKGEGRT